MTGDAIDNALKLALQHHNAGRLSDAEQIYRQILAGHPDNVDALHLLGVLAGQAGHPDAALELLQRAVQLRPGFAEIHNNLGNVLKNLGRLDDAMAAFRRALELKSDFADAHSNLGVVLKELGRLDEAIAQYRIALRLQPDFAQGFSNLSNALRENGQPNEAKRAAQDAIKLKPDFEPAHNNLGAALRELGLATEAIAAYQRAIQLKPDYAHAHANLGLAFGDLRRVDEAIASYERAIALKPEFPDPHWNLSQSLLLKGDFARGWREYEWRWKVPSLASPPRFHAPQWDGRPIPDQTLFLFTDQGLGDMIQFIRYAPMIADRGAKVVLECPAELMRLFEGFPGIDRMTKLGDAPPRFDSHIAMLGLPLAFGTVLQSIPADVPYLHASKELSEKWKSRLGPHRGRRRLGLCWSGRSGHKNDRNRSMNLSQLHRFSQVKDVEWISLQKGDASKHPAPAGLNLIDWTDDLTDFADTAALIANLDLVITVDTSVAHLAGAMGKPTWVMIPFIPDWRWMLDRIDSPWYPTMRLFRQPVAGDWPGVIESVVLQLQSARES